MLKVLLTILLVVQRSANSFILHAAGKKVEYSSAVAILISELIKELVCWVLAVYEANREAALDANNAYVSVPLFDIDAEQTERLMDAGPDSIVGHSIALIGDQTSTQPQEKDAGRLQRIMDAMYVVNSKTCNKEALLLMLPAALYVVQNNLIMFAAPKMEPSVFQAAWQVRLLPTAYLSGWILRKTISAKQWICLFGVLLGVIIIEVASTWRINAGLTAELKKKLDIHNLTLSRDLLIGTTALFVAAIISAFASVMLEKIYSSKGKSLWVANFQLSFFSILPALFLVIIECSNATYWWSPFASIFRSLWPWAVILAQAFVGILVGLMTKYAGSVGNGLAGIGSIALTSFIALILPEDGIRSTVGKILICLGIIATIVCTHLYSSCGENTDRTYAEEEAPMQDKFDMANFSLESVSVRPSIERY